MILVYYLVWMMLILRCGFLFYRISNLKDGNIPLRLRDETFFLGMTNLIIFLFVWIVFKNVTVEFIYVFKLLYISGFIWYLYLWRLFLRMNLLFSKVYYVLYIVFWISLTGLFSWFYL